MRVAVIGAGIVGVATAYELAADGHAVTVFERRGSVAEEASFANGGLVAPGWSTPWGLPGSPDRLWRPSWGRPQALSLARPWARGQLGWMWRWLRSNRGAAARANLTRLHGLARYSQQRLQRLGQDLGLQYEQSTGCLVLLRDAHDLADARAGLGLLTDLGVPCHVVDADQARRLEPGLNPQGPLHAAVHLPSDGAGNCRQFAHLLKRESERLGVDFRFHRAVQSLVPGLQPQVTHHWGSASRHPQLGAAQTEVFDAVVVCAALGSAHLLQPLGARLPLATLHGHALSAPLRHLEGHPALGPLRTVADLRHRVTVARLGQRVRVAGSAELGGRADTLRAGALDRLYQVLQDWFPGAAQLAQVQRWKGAQAVLPDGPPVLGASGAPGVWLNLGHGALGWALACGSARVLADQLGGRSPAIDVAGLDITRLLRR